MNTPAVVDRQLEHRLKDEWPGILRWLIDGCLDWQANGLIRPAAVLAATESYFSEQDVMGQWMAEKCDTNPNAVETTAALFTDWESFAHAAGDYAGTRRSFATELDKMGFRLIKSGKANVRSVLGIKLKSSPILKIVPKIAE
jgi:putative DNA primase/helicase